MFLGLHPRQRCGRNALHRRHQQLVRRGYEHRNDVVPGFTNKYAVHRLVYYEQFFDIENAIRREKRLKKWNRVWKIRLIEQSNPNWDDLYPLIASP